jgi:hypothetical protein
MRTEECFPILSEHVSLRISVHGEYAGMHTIKTLPSILYLPFPRYKIIPSHSLKVFDEGMSLNWCLFLDIFLHLRVNNPHRVLEAGFAAIMR